MEPSITTYTGRVVNPLDLKATDICIEDIAHALACLNRFGGHARVPISVAQHSVYVSRLCGGHALQGLLHDASEAYLCDITKWLKETPEFAAYRVAETRAQLVIYERFGCDPVQAPVVDEADILMVRLEAVEAYGAAWAPPPSKRDVYRPLDPHELARVGRWAPWAWQQAKHMFLDRFQEVTKGQR